MTEYNEVDRNALKVEALSQRISTIVNQYENQMADFRVEATISSQHLEAQVRELSDKVVNLEMEINRLSVQNINEEDVPQENE